MAITHRRYKDKNDYKRICTFLEKRYESYGTRFDDNLTLFEFQCALSWGLEEPVKSIDEALSKVFLWFDDEEFHIESVPNLKEHEEVYKAYKLCYGILFNKNIFQSFYETSTYRNELALVVMGPDRNIVGLCSGRYDEVNKLVTIEAVSCSHDYRRRRISKALLLHQLNAAKDLGADKATVTATPKKYPTPNSLYESVGFNLVGDIFVWKKNKI